MKQIFKTNKTFIMGILNITPDSFSDGGKYIDVKSAVARAREMVTEGADIIDIGGESTRPGAESVSVEDELKRVIPVIQAIRKELDVPISIDTYKSLVAEKALQEGATILNSLGGFTRDPELMHVAQKYQHVVIYHIKGQPRTMQKGEIVYSDVIKEISEFFEMQIEMGIQNGMKREQFILDPGMGFGKTVDQNFEIVQRLKELATLKLPLLFGASRKSHLGIFLKDSLQLKEIPGLLERLEATLAETAVAVLNGAKIVRTHDVLATKKFLSVIDRLK